MLFVLVFIIFFPNTLLEFFFRRTVEHIKNEVGALEV